MLICAELNVFPCELMVFKNYSQGDHDETELISCLIYVDYSLAMFFHCCAVIWLEKVKLRGLLWWTKRRILICDTLALK